MLEFICGNFQLNVDSIKIILIESQVVLSGWFKKKNCFKNKRKELSVYIMRDIRELR